MSIEKLWSPAKIEKVQGLEKNFQNKEIQKRVKKFLEKNEVEWEGGELKDFLKVVEEKNISSFSAVRELVKIYEENKIEVAKEEISLPLDYVENIFAILDEEDWKKYSGKSSFEIYEDIYNKLSPDDKKFFLGKNEIAILRQSPDAKKQAIVEAVANGIDAMSLEKIGEKGLGIKQALAYIQDGGKIQVLSKEKDGKLHILEVDKSLNGRFQEKIQEIELENFSESGTEILVEPDQKLSEKEIQDILEEVRKKFRLTMEVEIYLNGELVNDYEKISDINGEKVEREKTGKRVEVEISDNKILIRDNGVGMNEEKLSKMFIPRQGDKKMETVPEKKVDVFFIKNENGQVGVNIARKQEVLESHSLKSQDKFLNLLNEEILINSNFLRVPEARQSVFVDKDFFKTLEQAVEKVFQGGRSLEEKIQFANSMALYLDEFLEEKAGKGGKGSADVREFVKNTKDFLGQSLKEITKDKEIKFIPNDVFFQKFLREKQENQIFLNTDLYDFNPEKLDNFRSARFFKGKHIFEIDTEEDFTVAEFKGNYFLNKKLLDKYQALSDEELEKKILEELMELAVNEVQTSYDVIQERRNKIEKEKEGKEKTAEEKQEEIKKSEKEFLADIEKLVPKELQKIGEKDFSDVIPKTKIIDGVECIPHIDLIQDLSFGQVVFNSWLEGSEEQGYLSQKSSEIIIIYNDGKVEKFEGLAMEDFVKFDENISYLRDEDKIIFFGKNGEKVEEKAFGYEESEVDFVVKTETGYEIVMKKKDDGGGDIIVLSNQNGLEKVGYDSSELKNINREREGFWKYYRYYNASYQEWFKEDLSYNNIYLKDDWVILYNKNLDNNRQNHFDFMYNGKNVHGAQEFGTYFLGL